MGTHSLSNKEIEFVYIEIKSLFQVYLQGTKKMVKDDTKLQNVQVFKL